MTTLARFGTSGSAMGASRLETKLCQRFRAMGVAPHIVELTLTTAARLSVVWPEFISGIRYGSARGILPH